MIEYIQAAPAASFIFAITLITSLYVMFVDWQVSERFMLYPYRMVREREYGRLLTVTLVHGGGAHLAFNMLTFYFFAFQLEEYYLGSWRFVVLYLAGTLASGIPDVIRHKDNPAYRAVGASGAISAVLLSFALFEPGAQLYLFFFVPIKAWVFAIGFVLLSFYLDRVSRDRIAHGAHAWGAVAGLVFTPLLRPEALETLADFIKSF